MSALLPNLPRRLLTAAVRGYRMADVDDALGRLGAELAERDARIADLEAALAGARALTDDGGLGGVRRDGARQDGPRREPEPEQEGEGA